MIRVCCARNSCRCWSDSSGVSCASTKFRLTRRNVDRPSRAISVHQRFPAMNGMKLVSIIAAVAGVAVTALLVAWFGVGAVLHAIRAVGIVGFAAICALHLGLIIPLGTAWKALLPDVAVPKAVWARLVRDSVAEALPLSQVGGYVAGARALSLTGVTLERRGREHDRRCDARIFRPVAVHGARIGAVRLAAAGHASSRSRCWSD